MLTRIALYFATFLALAGGCCPLFSSTAPGTPPKVTVIYNTPTVTPTLVPLTALVCGGGKIAFVGGEHDSKPQLYVMNGDGSDLRRLTNMTYGISNYSRVTWSPDGQQIAFVAGNIYIINSDSSGLHKLTHVNYTLSDPAWSPDGKKIAFSASGTEATDVFIINADGSELKQITHNKNHDYYSSNSEPFWSLDSKQIAYTWRHSQADNITSDTYTMNADGTGEQSLVRDVTPFSKAWLSNGTYIPYDLIFVSFSPNDHCLLLENDSHLYLATPNGFNIQPLPGRLPTNFEVQSPTWGH